MFHKELFEDANNQARKPSFSNTRPVAFVEKLGSVEVSCLFYQVRFFVEFKNHRTGT